MNVQEYLPFSIDLSLECRTPLHSNLQTLLAMLKDICTRLSFETLLHCESTAPQALMVYSFAGLDSKVQSIHIWGDMWLRSSHETWLNRDEAIKLKDINILSHPFVTLLVNTFSCSLFSNTTKYISYIRKQRTFLFANNKKKKELASKRCLLN